MTKTIGLLILLMGMCSTFAMAEDQSQHARMQQVLRQLGMEKQQLTDQLEKLRKENAEVKAANGKLETKVKSLDQRVDKSAKANQAAVERIDQFNERLKETLAKLRETVMELRKAEATLGSQKAQVTACMRLNVQLYDAGKDLLTKYEEKGVWDALAQREPITGLKQVEVENLIEDYRYTIEGLTVSKQAEKQILEENQDATSAVRKAHGSGQQTVDAVAPLVDEGQAPAPVVQPAAAQ
jgi:cytochrome c556